MHVGSQTKGKTVKRLCWRLAGNRCKAGKLTWVALEGVGRETGQKPWSVAIYVVTGSGDLETALTRSSQSRVRNMQERVWHGGG